MTRPPEPSFCCCHPPSWCPALNTVRVLLPEHDVHITDWANARDVGIWKGRFGFDEYIEHLIRFLEAMGPGAHVVAVCQPCVQALAAAAIMAEDDNPAQPRSMTLMAGPTCSAPSRRSPTPCTRQSARALPPMT